VLIHLLREAARREPALALVITESGTVTYQECLTRSEQMAIGLRTRGVERFACAVSDIGEVIALLCASTAVGAEACVYSPTLDADAIATLAERFDHKVVVADRDIAGVNVVAPGELVSESPGQVLGDAPDRAPALILTTGTTGQPKGARHEWSRLVAAVRRDERQHGARWLLAYNLNQFAGIQVLIHVLANHATLVAGASNQPRAALDAMRDFGVTHASATPTFWRFLTALLDSATAANLTLQQITLGGEAVPGALLDDLRSMFPKANVSQIYASTEAGSTVSVRDAHNGLPASVLERSDASDAQMKIVDGELHIRSNVGMLGYYGEPDDDAAGWRATGDLVEVRDGRVYFVGRTTDTINVGGVKVHPLPVEEVAGRVPGVRLVRAYGRPNPLTGFIVAVDVVAESGFDEATLKEDIRTACEVLPDAARPRRIRFTDTLPTDGNKLVRKADR
jgi:acyl-coenzyme A synthetase/AMP-(fatty) acid ligase